MKKYCFILCCSILAWNSAHSQVEGDSILYSVKGEYIEKFPNRITAKALYTNTYNSYVFIDKETDLSFNLEPNKQNRIGASVAYSFITLSYSFSPNFLSENQDNDDSRLFNLNLRAFFGKWTQTIDVYSEKGFYEVNSGFYLPETNSLKIGGSTSYIFNDKFSFRAISNQDEKQLKSAGSFIAGVNYYYSKFNLLLENGAENVDEDIYFYDIAVTPGYRYNFVPLSNILLSAGVNVGIGVNHSRSEFENKTSLLTLWGVSGTATYDIENFFLGGRFNYLAIDFTADKSTYTEDRISFFQVFIGYRFKAPKKWVKTTEEIMEKLHLQP